MALRTSPSISLSKRWALFPIALLQACVSTTAVIQKYPEKPVPRMTQPIEPPPPPPMPTQPVPSPLPEETILPGSSAPSVPAAPIAPSNDPPAILALRSEAEASAHSGDLDNAATALERAIRIQPKNPQLWHDLAAIRLKQQQPGLAEDLAMKSNLHAKGNAALARSNWAIVADARRLKGDAAGEAEARRNAGE